MEWSGTGCNIVPFPHLDTSGSDKVTGKMRYSYSDDCDIGMGNRKVNWGPNRVPCLPTLESGIRFEVIDTAARYNMSPAVFGRAADWVMGEINYKTNRATCPDGGRRTTARMKRVGSRIRI